MQDFMDAAGIDDTPEEGDTKEEARLFFDLPLEQA